jgi:capsular exopolysaccharide synthesis family protein
MQTGRQVSDDNLDQGANAETGPDGGLTLNDLVKMLMRHKWFILICLVVCGTVAYLYGRSATPIYEATATIRIDPSRASSLGLQELISGSGGGGGEDTQTEIAIMKSDTVAINTLDSLTPEDFKLFSGAEKSQLAIPANAAALTPAQEGLLAHLKGSVTAHSVEGTQIVAISCRDPHPQLAATIVNHVIAAYLRQSFDSRYGSVAQVSEWLSAEMNTLKTRASDAQKRLADFQEKNNILGTDTENNTTIDRLRLLNSRLATAQAQRIVREAQMRTAMAAQPAMLAAMFPTPQLTALNSEESQLDAQYAQLSSKFGPNYPPLQEIKKQQARLDADLAAAVEKTRDRARQEYQASVTQEGMLQSAYDAQTQQAYALNRQQAEYAVLLAEGSSSRDLYDTLQYKLQEAGVSAGLDGVNTMLVDTARAPLAPVEPKRTQILGFGIALGLFAGIGSAFLREALSDKVQSVDQLERAVGYHSLASIPHMVPRGEDAAGTGAAAEGSRQALLVTARDPLSREAEAYRTLRNSMLLSSIDNPAKTVLVTSTLPSEGKSITAANYSVVLAQNGSRVLIIDADLRRPTLHKAFGVENTIGLSNMILGEVTERPTRLPVPELPNLHLLTAGKKVPLPSEALGSARFYDLLLSLEKDYDYIIVDSAPLLIVSDSLPLANWVDALVLVTRYNQTPLSALRRIRDVLARTNANVAGFIINDVSGLGAEYGGYGYAYYN